MINTSKLKGVIAENGISQRELASKLGMQPETFYRKMKKGVFDSDEINEMILILGIEDPIAIFFANCVTY